MSRLVGLTIYRWWPSKALPLAGGISAKRIVSTNNLSSHNHRFADGHGGVAGLTPMEAAGGTTPKG